MPESISSAVGPLLTWGLLCGVVNSENEYICELRDELPGHFAPTTP